MKWVAIVFFYLNQKFFWSLIYILIVSLIYILIVT